MNIKAVRFLLWEHAARTYMVWVAAFAGCFASCLAAFVYLSRFELIMPPEIVTAYNVTYYGMGFCIGAYVVALLLWAADDRDLQFDMPRYLLRLPVKTGTLVTCAFGWDVISTAALAGASMVVFTLFFEGQLEARMPVWGFVMVFPTMMAFLRVVTWSVGRSGPAVGIFAMVALTVAGYQTLNSFGYWPTRADAYLTKFSLTFIGICYVLAYAIIRWDRKGKLTFLENLKDFIPGKAAKAGRDGRAELALPPRFSSADAALRWYETRRQTRLFPALVVILFAGIWVLGALRDWLAMTEPFDYSNTVVLVVLGEILFVTANASLAIGAILSSGIFLYQNQRALLGRGRTFIFVRPASTRALASARLRAVLGSLVTVLIPVIMVWLVVFFLDMQSTERSVFRPFIDEHFGLTGIVIAALCLVAVAAAAWTSLWLANGVAFMLLLAIPTIALEYTPFFSGVEEITRGYYAMRAVSVLALIATIALFVLAWKKNLTDYRFAVAAIVAVPVLGAAALTIANLHNLSQGTYIDYGYLTNIVPAVVLLPLLPFLTVPLATKWARHR